MTRTNLKAGTRVLITGHDWNGETTYEPATILRWHRVSGPREAMPGYHRIRFDADGGVLLAHENRMVPA